MTFTFVAQCLAVELSLPVFTTKVCGGWDSNTQPSAHKANALTNCATAAAPLIVILITYIIYHIPPLSISCDSLEYL